ncbi:hypothetical protein [Corynebacterium sp. UBA2622]|uniref:hypothetical protein n=1 Tax=Corynebacterium sp. UBA2622 TaxID=1946393 RepID=UPI0025C5171C|nr:hypothetical protein [Corynebacterium sp. UBA2622]
MESNDSRLGDYYEGAGGYDRETVRFFDVAHEGAQMRAVAHAVDGFARLRGMQPRSVVVVGTDQVSRAAAACALALRTPLPVPAFVTPALPAYVGPLDVVAVVGDCADDARTGQDTRSLLTAARRGAETVFAGPSRGPIVEDVPDSVFVIPPLPTTSSASPLRAMATVWAVLDSLVQPGEITREFLLALADGVDAELEALSPQRDDTVNAARQLRTFTDGARVLHTGSTPCGGALAGLVAQLWSVHGIPSGYASAPELPSALENANAGGGGGDIFHDPFLDDGPQLVPLKTVVWAESDSVLPASRAETVEEQGLGDAEVAARLVARAYAATAMDA